MDRKILIQEIEHRINVNTLIINNQINIQKLKQDDIRVSFFKHFINLLDSTLISFICSHKYFGNEEWWINIKNEYNLNFRPFDFDKEFDYYDQNLLNSFMLYSFANFESSIRFVIKTYNSDLFENQPSFNRLLKNFLKKFQIKIEDIERFIDLSTRVRNSIHNNGNYFPSDKVKNKDKKKILIWNNTIYTFKPYQPIEINNNNWWQHNLASYDKYVEIFKAVISNRNIINISFIQDPQELSE